MMTGSVPWKRGMLVLVCIGLICLIADVGVLGDTATARSRQLKEDSLNTDNQTNRTAPSMYDGHGWHLAKHDMLSKAVNPASLQPYYIMPVAFACKLMFTMIIFGSEIRFKTPSGEAGGAMDTLMDAGKLAFGLVTIAIAINGYYVDYCRFVEFNSYSHDFVHSLGLFAAMVVTSSNFVSAWAIWGTLQLENPATLLFLKANFVSVPMSPGIPIFQPFQQVKFYGHVKWTYAMILLPYTIVFTIVNLAMSLAAVIWAFSVKCTCCFWTVLSAIRCECAFIFTVLSLGFWGWARSCLVYWWGKLWPTFYYVAMQSWAAIIAPYLFAILFGLALCSPLDDIKDALLSKAIQPKADSDEGQGPKVASLLSVQDIENLREVNRDRLGADFDSLLLTPEDQQGPERSSIKRVKVSIFFATLKNMSAIMGVQLVIFILFRQFDTHDENSLLAGMYRTVTERHLVAYIDYVKNAVQSAVQETPGKAVDLVWR